MSSLQKKLTIFSLFTSQFFIRNKRHKRRGTFFERGGGNSLKRTYVGGVGWGTCEGGSKTESFERTYFLNYPKGCNHQTNDENILNN